MTALPAGGDVNIDGFMCPGHVSVITGAAVYEAVAQRLKMPCVVAGFEAADMVTAVRMLLQQTVDERAEVEIEYTRSVTQEGNIEAKALCEEVMTKCDAEWRGLGVISGSGLRIRDEFAAHDAGRIFEETISETATHGSSRETGCVCGDVLRGVLVPTECSLFGTVCTPSNPVGPCMVSSEGTCAAYYRYGRKEGSPKP
jgi:hydrogenase expression/formation protein HypD